MRELMAWVVGWPWLRGRTLKIARRAETRERIVGDMRLESLNRRSEKHYHWVKVPIMTMSHRQQNWHLYNLSGVSKLRKVDPIVLSAFCDVICPESWTSIEE